MAEIASPITTYADTTPQKRTITDFISLIDPADTKAIDAMGGWDGASSKFRFVNTPGTTVEWLMDDYRPLTGTFAMADSCTLSTTVTLTVADANAVQVGDIIEPTGGEHLWISAKAAAVITVTRCFNGTSSATLASLAAYTIVGQARLEGAASAPLGYSDRTSASNYNQIFHKEIEVTRDQAKIAQYGIANEFDYQSAKAIPELSRLVEKQLYLGVSSAGSATMPRTFGGYSAFITTNTVSGASLVQSKFEAAVQAAYEGGGSGHWYAMVGPTMASKIKNFYDSSLFLRVDRGETTVGMAIESIATPFGTVDLILDRWCPTTLIPILDAEHVGMYTFDPFFQEPLAKTGDSVKGQVVGEFTLCLRSTKAHAILTACS
jgi:hypothetical protein